ncbi:SOH1-domain-containing protein [Rickenella mellea]|uniref:Mediator of RNA polymerase II transcription subunit 31 n=1 Tax=Rickenella mellea TaxID=50990 RepID=A0A4Y7PNQ8_9AGAM|nr:SOH1-domain-containing protein [Rickenella mellea]
MNPPAPNLPPSSPPPPTSHEPTQSSPLLPSQPPDPQREANRNRFELELEFLQALANPFYLHSLAQQGILSQPAFINFLKYLMYWREREYVRFVQYPHALHHLELLQHEQFRTEIGKDEWREFLNQKQFDHWRTWRNEPLHAPSMSIGASGVAESESESVPPMSAVEQNVIPNLNGGMH